jgi:CRP-like cAMP-binding protein
MSANDKRVAFLKKVSTFEGVSEEGLAKLARICREIGKKAGEAVIKEGEQGDCVYIIEEGQVEITMSITMMAAAWEDKNEAVDKVLVKLGPGALFGEMAFIFDHDVRSATIVALADTMLLSITSADFQAFAREAQSDAYRIVVNIARIIAQRLRKTNADVKKLTTVLSIALSRPRKL